MIIPVFVPHEGCPNDCAFCNQRAISGKQSAPGIDEARNTIEEYLSAGKKADQIAFFGGSFTGIDIEKQNEYLSLAQEYIQKGSVKSIRLSTRPDYISNETVKRLIFYGVKNIELGAQSMDENVLRLAKRGHSTTAVEKAADIINESGAVLGLQMMTGLPGDTPEKCLYTARRFLDLGAKETRIYPTVVLQGTYLETMLKNGEYVPQSVEDAVEISAKLYRFFLDCDIKVLRIGLPDSKELKESFIAGAYHPSLGELVMSRDIRNRVEAEISGKSEATISVNPAALSKFNGNRKCNIEYFSKKGVKLNVLIDNTVEEFCILR